MLNQNTRTKEPSEVTQKSTSPTTPLNETPEVTVNPADVENATSNAENQVESSVSSETGDPEGEGE